MSRGKWLAAWKDIAEDAPYVPNMSMRLRKTMIVKGYKEGNAKRYPIMLRMIRKYKR